jgi:hypothetical protein
MKTICPVCDDITEISVRGTIDMHLDTVGNTCPMVGQPAPEWDERSTRAAVRSRSNGICEFCRQRASDMHHRVSRGVGGPWNPANIVHLCRACHHKCTTNPSWGRSWGLVLRTKQDPEDIPVMRNDFTSFQPTSLVTMPKGKR